MVDAYLLRFAGRASLADARGGAARLALDHSGYAQVHRGRVIVGVSVLEERGVLMIFSPIMPIPGARREAFYRRLLELSFVRSADAAFAINPPRDEVVVRALRRLSGLDYEEFEDLLTTVGEVADTVGGELVSAFPA